MNVLLGQFSINQAPWTWATPMLRDACSNSACVRGSVTAMAPLLASCIGGPVPLESRQGRLRQRYGENGERLLAGYVAGQRPAAMQQRGAYHAQLQVHSCPVLPRRGGEYDSAGHADFPEGWQRLGAPQGRFGQEVGGCELWRLHFSPRREGGKPTNPLKLRLHGKPWKKQVYVGSST
jgi:hypothetical protein